MYLLPSHNNNQHSPSVLSSVTSYNIGIQIESAFTWVIFCLVNIIVYLLGKDFLLHLLFYLSRISHQVCIIYIFFIWVLLYNISNSSAGQSLWIFDSFQTTFHLLHEHFWRKQKNKKVDDCITFVFREHCNMQYVRKAKVVMQNLDEWSEVVQSVDHW